MLQLVIGSHSKGSESKSGSKHIMVFCLYFLESGKDPTGKLPFFTRSFYRSWISLQLFEHN